MKKFIQFIVISLIIGGIFNVAAQEQTTSSYPTVKKVKEIPNWFLKPAQNEYVGVSLPFKDEALAMQQAINSALLSYMVQHNIYGTLENSIEMLSTVDGAKNTYSTYLKELYDLKISQPSLNYQITKAATNDNGDFFVSLKILPLCGDSKVNFSLSGLFKANTYSTTAFEIDEFIKYLFIDSTGFSMLSDISIKYTENNQQGIIKTSILDFKTEKKEANLLNDNSNCCYQSTKKIKYDSKKVYILSAYPLKQSLGAAYLTALLKLMTDERNWAEGMKTGSVSSSRYHYSRRKPTPIHGMQIAKNELFIVAEHISSKEVMQQKEQGKKAKKEAKKWEKDGWKTLGLPIATQLENLWRKYCEKDASGYPKYIIGFVNIKDYNLINATTQASYRAKERIAGEIMYAMENLIRKSLKNGELTKEEGASVLNKLDAMVELDFSLADSIKDGASIMRVKESAKLTPIITELSDVSKVLEIYRERTDKSIEVRISLTFDTYLITDVAKRTLRKLFADNEELLKKIESLKIWDNFHSKDLYDKPLYHFLDDEIVE